MATVRKMATTALRKIKVLANGEDIEDTDLDVLAEEIGRMLDTWKLESLMVVAHTTRSYALDPSKNSYTFYSDVAADFNGPRPVSISSATLRDDSGRGWPLAELTAEQWSASSTRTIQSRPSGFYYEPSFPIAYIKLDAMPDTAWPLLELVTMEGATIDVAEAAYDTEITFAPGYEDAIIYNLATRVHEDFGVPLPKDVAGFAMSFKALIKRANLTVPLMVTDVPVSRGQRRGTYDIRGGPNT